jgi:hypothetical protein
MTESAKIVPFGKYKGQPVEAMVQDRSYVEWLTAQPWFKEKFTPIYNVVINNFGEPSETPEHNALQALFLDNEFCYAFLCVVYDDFSRQRQWILRRVENEANHSRQSEREQRVNADAAASRTWLSEDTRASHRASALQMAEQCATHAAKFEEFLSNPRFKIACGADFEVDGADVRIWWRSETDLYISSGLLKDSGELKVEIKPVLADDYPAVLRQMKRNGSSVLLVDSYIGTGATAEQVKKIFAASHLMIVSRGAVQRLMPQSATEE